MKPKEFWISKGSSNFCNELHMDEDFLPIKVKPDDFYDIVSTKDTLVNSIHVIEKSAYNRLMQETLKLKEALGENISWLQRMSELRWGDADYAPNFKKSVVNSREALSNFKKFEENV